MRVFLILVMLCYNIDSFSQEVSIELSSEWRKTESNRWRFAKRKETPFLNITYINNSNNSIYFLKVPTYFDIQVYDFALPIDKREKKNFKYFKNRPKHDNEKYFVEISPNNRHHIWQVEDEKERKNTNEIIEVGDNNVNRDLQEIYKYLYKDYKYMPSYSIFCNSDEVNIIMTPENIKTKLRGFFVFLKPGEKYIDSYDLTGFSIFGGQYTFALDNNKSREFVQTIFLKKEKVYKKEMLPKQVDGYELFVGEFLTNNLDVIFK